MFVADRSRLLVLGEDSGLAPAIAFAEQLSVNGAVGGDEKDNAIQRTLVLLGSNATFPFRPRPSTIIVPGLPSATIACAPSLEEMGIASRLATPAGYPGCFDGTVIELASQWLDSLERHVIDEMGMAAFGPPALLHSARVLAQEFGIALREHESDIE